MGRSANLCVIFNMANLHLLIPLKLVNLGINFRSYQVKHAIVRGDQSITLPCGTVLWLVRRDPAAEPQFGRYKYMYDLAEAATTAKDCVVDADHGFCVVSQDKSILFFSGGMCFAHIRSNC